MEGGAADPGREICPGGRLQADKIAQAGGRFLADLLLILGRRLQPQGLLEPVPGVLAITSDPGQPQGPNFADQGVVQVGIRFHPPVFRGLQGGAQLGVVPQHTSQEAQECSGTDGYQGCQRGPAPGPFDPALPRARPPGADRFARKEAAQVLG